MFHQSSSVQQLVGYLLLLSVLTSCASQTKPPRRVKLPPELAEASGLAIKAPDEFYLHNDSGDDPLIYRFSLTSGLATPQRIPTRAIDWEDMTVDAQGRFYLADTGNNAGRRSRQAIYRYDPKTEQTDSIIFTYPNQNAGGRLEKGNYDCEAIVYHRDSLHLFTKALAGRAKSYWAHHFVLPARPGQYEAVVVDSLYLPRRVITAAALDTTTRQLVFTTYNYKRVLGFFPAVASSLITISDYPGNYFLRGKLKRRNLSWAFPTQYEAVDFYDERYLYIATERTVGRRQGLRRIRR